MNGSTAVQLAESLEASPDPSLKGELRRAERIRKLKYLTLIAPLTVFVLLVFVWPIASLLGRSVSNPEIVAVFPHAAPLLREWGGQELPPEPVFAATVADLTAARGTQELTAAAKRLNMEESGFRSLLVNTARKLPLQDAATARQGLVALDARWGEPATWRAMRRNAGSHTGFYLLSALDLMEDAQGSIAKVSEDRAIYVDILGRTFWMSLVVTLCCLALGFPLAYLIANTPARIGNILMIFVMLPFWTSILVRVAAWIVLLQTGGVINQLLLALGLIDHPLQLVFNRFGVYVAMVHILLPFMILPLYSVMKGISPTYMRAALSLGCHPVPAFVRIYLPLVLPGVAAGGLLVFILSMGYYITPALLGSPKEQMTSYFVAFYTNETLNWGMAAALSAILLAATLLLYAVYMRMIGSTGKPAKR